MRTSTLTMTMALLVLAACDNGANKNNSNPDLLGGVSNEACTPNRAECVTATLARVCPADGSGWLPLMCQGQDTCQNGICVAPTPGPAKICTPGEMKCEKGTSNTPDQSLKCNADGTAFDKTACPTSTACIGAGLCEGRCIVGSSTCVSATQIGTCNADGNSVNAVDCPTDQLCVQTATDPFPTAACKPAECTPSQTGCTLECGNRLDANADQTRYLSECRATSDGYKWVAIACPASTICDDTGGKYCGGLGKLRPGPGLSWDAACVPENPTCTNGATRCSDDRLSLETCQNGAWIASACNTSSTLSACLYLGPSKAVCGDFSCADGHDGECATNSTIRLCKDGFLQPATACDVGFCAAQAFGSSFPSVIYDIAQLQGIVPGFCTYECLNGDQRCSDGPYVEDCVNNVWVPGASCTNCRTVASTTNPMQRKALCGAQCMPGAARCSGSVYIPKLGDIYTYDTKIEVCGSDGKYQAATTCTYGACYTLVPPTDLTVENGVAACLGQCTPGSTTCASQDGPAGAGTNLGVTGSWAGNVYGWDYALKCDANGRFSTVDTDTIDCDAGMGSGQTTYCRKDNTGKSLGCKACVGSSLNNLGLKDTRCNNNGPQTCGTDDKWPSSTPVDCGVNYYCYSNTSYDSAMCIFSPK